MQLLELKIFRDLAYERNFVKVAKLNHLTQPSISSHLKHLESEMGVRLLNRVPRKVSLTKEGELLLPHVEDLLARSDNLSAVVSRSKQIPKGDVRLATVYSIGLYELPAILKKSIRSHPDILIHLQYRRSDIIYDLVLKNKIDIGIVAYPEIRSKIDITPFGSDQLVLIVPPNHRLAKRRSIRLKQIAGENFIGFEPGVPTGEAIDQILKARGIQVVMRMMNDNIDTVKKAVEVGLGISIVPSKTVEAEAEKGTLQLVKIEGAKLVRPLGILTLKDRAPSYAMQIFIETLTGKKNSSRP